MNDGVRKLSFGALLSGKGGGCVVVTSVVLAGGMALAGRDEPIWVGACAFLLLVMLAIWARRLEIHYDLSANRDSGSGLG